MCTCYLIIVLAYFTEMNLCKILYVQTFTGTPVLALAGTADSSTQQTIIDSLAIKKSCIKIFVSPNRPNIRISVCKTSKSEIFTKLNWLISMVKVKGRLTPKTLIFCNTMTDIANVLNYLLMILGESAYHPTTSRNICDCLIGVYHANTWSHTKEMIVSSLKNVTQSTKRIIIASTALSMGVNFPDIEYIINWGPPRTLLDYHQEAG